jgi:hypothetical protein
MGLCSPYEGNLPLLYVPSSAKMAELTGMNGEIETFHIEGLLLIVAVFAG